MVVVTVEVVTVDVVVVTVDVVVDEGSDTDVDGAAVAAGSAGAVRDAGSGALTVSDAEHAVTTRKASESDRMRMGERYRPRVACSRVSHLLLRRIVETCFSTTQL